MQPALQERVAEDFQSLDIAKRWTMEKVEVAPQEMMLNLIGGFWITRSIYLAAKLGVADWFDAQPKTIIAQLAQQAACDSRALYRLTRALC